MSRSPPRVPWLYRTVRDRSGQSTVVGTVLLLGLTMIGTGVIVTLGATALGGTQTQADLERVEHGMTLFDSRTSTVALGESTRQSVSLRTQEGSFTVEPNEGSIEIVHVNYTGTGTNHTLLPETPLGALVYENGESTIAYQGGGVWRTYEGGGTEMVSPPEFHYRDATLTFPLIRMSGNGSGSGSSTIQIEESSRGVPVYPKNTTYPNGDPYENPVSNGSVEITIESQYADAWASYFRSRTEGTVTQPSQNEVRVELITLGQLGAFTMPQEDNSISVRGLASGHTLNEYRYTLYPQDTESSSFNNLKWSFWAESGSQQFEVTVKQSGGGGVSCNEDVSLSIYYSPDGGANYHGWQNSTAFTTECGEYNGDLSDGDEVRLRVSLVPPSGKTMTYTSFSNDDLVHFNPNGNLISNPSFTGHAPDPGPTGSTENLTLTMNHYFALMGPDFDLTVDDKNSAGVGESASTGFIDYGGGGKVVTYLHVSQNNVTVTVN